jgi:hypothetical protein
MLCEGSKLPWMSGLKQSPELSIQKLYMVGWSCLSDSEGTIYTPVAAASNLTALSFAFVQDWVRLITTHLTTSEKCHNVFGGTLPSIISRLSLERSLEREISCKRAHKFAQGNQCQLLMSLDVTKGEALLSVPSALGSQDLEDTDSSAFPYTKWYTSSHLMRFHQTPNFITCALLMALTCRT